jgi:uncharacterized protein YdhG (YjbR/CyaY superfamily)
MIDNVITLNNFEINPIYMELKVPENVDSYIAGFPENIRDILQQVRETIKNAAPGAEEVISYQMPAYKLNGMLVYFAGHTNHIGFYPTSSGIQAFKHEFAGLKWSKGAVQFPVNKLIPFDLIERIVRFRVIENSLKNRNNRIGNQKPS